MLTYSAPCPRCSRYDSHSLSCALQQLRRADQGVYSAPLLAPSTQAKIAEGGHVESTTYTALKTPQALRSNRPRVTAEQRQKSRDRARAYRARRKKTAA